MSFNPFDYKNIVILTGAGISAGSGLPTYRGPKGIWEQYNVAEFGNIQAFQNNPLQVWQLYGSMRTPLLAALPNAAHLALATFESNLQEGQKFLIVTQNVDGLHQRAGSKNIVELHGNIGYTCCSNKLCTLKPFLDTETHEQKVPICPNCSSALRPQIVLFGESVSAHAEWTTKRALRDCDLFIAIGTSGSVSPASNFVRSADYAGAHTVYINLTPLAPPNPYFKEIHLGPAEELLPQLIGSA